MRKRNLHQSTHPFDDYPYEVFYNDSWHPVERLQIRNGKIYTHLVDGEDIIEEDTPLSNHRIRPRKANLSDCTCFLRPGVDVCVLSSQPTENSSAKEHSHEEPVWLDAKINSIERKPHEPECACQFYITFYVNQSPQAVLKKALQKEIVQVNIDQILIIQKLDRVPCENDYYRWDCSEDCSSIKNFKLFSGKFASDLTWLVVSSVMRQVEFDVYSVRNKVVYQILDDGNDKCFRAVNFKMENEMLVPVFFPFTPPDTLESEIGDTINEDGSSFSYDVMCLRRSKRRYVKPERYLGCGGLTESDIDEARLGFCKIYRTETWEYEEMPLALSIQADHAFFRGEQVPSKNLVEYKKLKKPWKVTSPLPLAIEGPNKISQQRNDTSSREVKSVVHDDRQSDQSESDHDESKDQKRLAVVSYADEEDPFDTDFQENYSKEVNNVLSSYIHTSSTAWKESKGSSGIEFPDNEHKWNWTEKHKNKKRGRKRKGFHLYPQKDSFRDLDSFRVTGSGRRRTFTASTYRDMIRRCMDNIKSTIDIEQTPVLDKWKEFQQSTKKDDDDDDSDSDDSDDDYPKREKVDPEVEMLFKEMEMCLASMYLLDDEDSDIGVQKKWAFDLRSEIETKAPTRQPTVCQHEFKLNEEIGILCQLCGYVSTEIKDVSPNFLNSLNPMANNASQDNEEDHNLDQHSGLDLLSIPAASNIPLSKEKDNVSALIPELKDQFRPHQKRAYEFLWRNIAGSSIPAEMESSAEKRGGCVISHSPGAGKTFLIIAFLVSYLKLFPGARPLVLAPKTTLYTWYKEIIKWKIPIPVYQIHGGQTYRGEIGRQKFKMKPGQPKPNQDVMHVLDCLEKIQRWLSHPSVLLMGYTSFLTLTRDDSKYAYRKYMGQVLRQCPGVLILDEGHNPRSTKSRLRKALMKVDTGLRILLSGTVFQNNFGEYFNTLTLARPIFVREVLMELDPAFRRRKKGAKTKFSLENRARKFFIEKISRRFDSHKVEEQMEALNILKNLTGEFIDVHEGGSSDNLPGLQIYTLMMKSTPYQQKLLTELQNQRPEYKGFPLELELLITLGAIHPWLIRTTACAAQYFTNEVLEDLEKYKFDLKFGSKVRFIMSLIPRCTMRNEKVLIFCHNIAPITLFIELFEAYYGWRRGIEVLVLQGDLELFERGRVMDKFEEPNGPSRVMLASITACAEGISLTAASRVILLDSEWNPSKSKQAIARAFRPGQAKEVYVYQLLAKGTLEEEKHSRTTWKEWLSCMIFSEELVEDPSKWQAEMIEDDVLREIVEEDKATLFHMIMKNIKASSSNPIVRGRD